MWMAPQRNPGEPSGEPDRAEIGNAGLSTDGRKAAEVATAEGIGGLFTGERLAERASDIAALLLGDRRDPRQRLSLGIDHMRRIADDEDLAMAG
jgi:hypothetical protein